MKLILPALLLPAALLAGPESIERLDPALDRYFAPDTEIETLCQGFEWAEGPVWVPALDALLFSDVPTNTVHIWREGDTEAGVFLKPSGFTGNDRGNGEPGSNGLALDAKGRLLSCEHGDRRVSVLTEKGGKMTLADRHQAKRFNSPNDLAVHSSGAIFFTDPPYGLPRRNPEQYRELDIHGVYRLDPDGTVTLLVDELDRPNGIALSPDEKTVYIAQSHKPKQLIMAYPLQPDLGVGEGRVVFDCTELEGPGLPDGLKVHPDGTIFTTGPGGLLVIHPDGTLLGRVLCTRPTANVAFGPDHRSLFLTSDDRLLRLPLAKQSTAPNR